jgi:hypothetical protein
VPDGFGAVAAGEPIGAEIAVRGPVFQHVLGGDEHRCSYARMAFLAPRRERKRWKWACRDRSF